MFPVAADVSHASPELAQLLETYFRVKSDRDRSGWMSYFSPDQLDYSDATLGWTWDDPSAFDEALRGFMANWQEGGLSYPLRVLGDMRGGIAMLVDTPELFGGEILALAPFDIRDGKIVRWVDYWDSRQFGAEAAAAYRTPAEQFPQTFGEDRAGEVAATALQDVCKTLASALARNDPAAVASLFSYDAVFEDLALRLSVSGPAAIQRYLGRTLPTLPYGPGSSVRHTVGSEAGGGYEWVNPAGEVRRGCTAVELDNERRITRLTAVWDSGTMPDAAMRSLAQAAVDA